MGSSNSKSESDTINWNNVKTENFTSNLPNFNSLSNDAKQLISSLNLPDFTQSETSDVDISNILSKFTKNTEQSEDLSNTSPFISSEMYDNLVNSKTSEQIGGAKSKKNKKYKNKKGGAIVDDDSDTSSTSSDSDLEDILESSEQDIKKNKDKKNKKRKESSDEDELSGGELSYISSSAHTGGEYSDSHSSSDSNSVQTTSQNNSTVTDENKQMMSTSVSVNTTDINMVSDY